MIHRRALPIIACVLLGAWLLITPVISTPLFHLQRSFAGQSKKLDSAALLHAYNRLPLAFEVNQGQADSRVQFLAHGPGYSLFFTNQGPVLDVSGKSGQELLHIQVIGAATQPRVAGLDELPGKTNYFLGNDPRSWLTNVPTYAGVLYRGVYPGVNLVYYGNQGELEYDFVLARGANPRAIGLTFAGAQQLGLDAQGNLLLHVGSLTIQQMNPVATRRSRVPGISLTATTVQEE